MKFSEALAKLRAKIVILTKQEVDLMATLDQNKSQPPFDTKTLPKEWTKLAEKTRALVNLEDSMLKIEEILAESIENMSVSDLSSFELSVEVHKCRAKITNAMNQLN